jgi:hypothetical protein
MTTCDYNPPEYIRLIAPRLIMANLLARGARPEPDWPPVDDLTEKAVAVLAGRPDADPIARAALDLVSGPVLDKAWVQALILLNEPADGIAAAVGLPQAAIEFFEKLAFDVRKLPDRTTIVPGASGCLPITVDDVEAVLHRIAVRFGRELVDEVVMLYRTGRLDPPGPVPDTAAEARKREFRIGFRQRVAEIVRHVDMETVLQGLEKCLPPELRVRQPFSIRTGAGVTT